MLRTTVVVGVDCQKQTSTSDTKVSFMLNPNPSINQSVGLSISKLSSYLLCNSLSKPISNSVPKQSVMYTYSWFRAAVTLIMWLRLLTPPSHTKINTSNLHRVCMCVTQYWLDNVSVILAVNAVMLPGSHTQYPVRGCVCFVSSASVHQSWIILIWAPNPFQFS